MSNRPPSPHRRVPRADLTERAQIGSGYRGGIRAELERTSHPEPAFAHADPKRILLPQIYRYATWHPDIGVVVSPLSRALPNEVCQDPTLSTRDSLEIPRYLEDSNLWLAFFPRNPYRGALFSILRGDLEKKIVKHTVLGSHYSGYQLSVAPEWAELETQLHNVATFCLHEHPRSNSFPKVVFEDSPHCIPYRSLHQTRQDAMNAAIDARLAFCKLAAFTSFTLSLWLTRFEDDCFDLVFQQLANHPRYPAPREWLMLLEDSCVCDISGGTRPGGFLDPFATRWGDHITRFTRASVPIWFVWGMDPLRAPIQPSMMSFRPNASVVRDAKHRKAVFAEIVLPHVILPQASTYSFDDEPSSTLPARPTLASEALSNALDDEDRGRVDLDRPPSPNPEAEPRAKVEANSRQKPREMWPEFYQRLMEGLERRKARESPLEKQEREWREKAALKSYGKKSTIYEWEQDFEDKSFYRRRCLKKAEVLDAWQSYSKFQRVYWSHLDEWDLCPQLPRCPPGETLPFDEDEDEAYYFDDQPDGSLVYKYASVPEPLPARPPTSTAENAHEDGNDVEPLSLQEYLHLQHGFDVSKASWTPGLHSEVKLEPTKWEIAFKRLLYDPSEAKNADPAFLQAIVEFHNVATRPDVHYKSLPPSWDLKDVEFHCDARILGCQRAYPGQLEDGTMYILRPGPESTSAHVADWFIATRSASTVLLAYRSGCTTIVDIARLFLRLGIAFRTVREVATRPLPRPRHLRTRVASPYIRGREEAKFRPQVNDYKSYVADRDTLLRSPAGRVIRTVGGLFWRFTSGIVQDAFVLDGPSFGDEVVARSEKKQGGSYFVDDLLDLRTLDFISGVFFLKSTVGDPKDCSFWPRYTNWSQTGYASDQWSPAAEQFFQTRSAELEAGRISILGGGAGNESWRIKHKQQMKFVKLISNHNEAQAAAFIDRSSRFTPFY
ncbi:hypothetical protein DXG01_013906 [Tephrocybe rancida]|nr:hypothetical protein DXG01_013906 [Tephrocybe rancida]